ncbi:MAG: hypothetical protein R2838_04900 [Caldilineaceae bacterium]
MERLGSPSSPASVVPSAASRCNIAHRSRSSWAISRSNSTRSVGSSRASMSMTISDAGSSRASG